MGLLVRAFLLSIFALAFILLQVQGFHIDSLCSLYTDGLDKKETVSIAMQEAERMKTLSREGIEAWLYNQRGDPLDDTRALVFGAIVEDYLKLNGYYSRLDTISWTLKPINPPVLDNQDNLLIYCGDKNFHYVRKKASSTFWQDRNTGYIFRFERESICSPGVTAQTLHSHRAKPGTQQWKFKIIILCDPVLVPGRGSLQELYQTGNVVLGTKISTITSLPLLSFVLFHQLLHTVSGKMLQGNSEKIGWLDCTTIDEEQDSFRHKTIHSADCLAYYALSLRLKDIDPDLFFFNGLVGSRVRADLAMLEPNNPEFQPGLGIFGG